MNIFNISRLSAGTILAIFVLATNSFAQTQVPADLRPFAVVELFTSEGCSSCPPADRILADLTQMSVSEDIPIYPLAFHVDYWNYLGWEDRFSRNQHTQRQRLYAYRRQSDRIFTPQVIINGTTSQEGYSLTAIQDSIREQLQRPARASILLNVRKNENALVVGFSLRGAPDENHMNFALVERGLVSQVLRGENAGKKLFHENVVKVFRSFRVRRVKGEISIPIPNDINIEESSLIVYVQDINDLSIWGVNKLHLRDLTAQQ